MAIARAKQESGSERSPEEDPDRIQAGSASLGSVCVRCMFKTTLAKQPYRISCTYARAQAISLWRAGKRNPIGTKSDWEDRSGGRYRPFKGPASTSLALKGKIV